MSNTTLLRDSTELFACISSMAGEGQLLSTTRRDSARVYSLTLNNLNGLFSSLPEGKWQVIYAYWPDSGEIMVEFVRPV